MNIREFDTDSFMAGYMARNEEVARTVRCARQGRKNVVKALYDGGLRDFRTMTLRAEAASNDYQKRSFIKNLIRKVIGEL